MFHIMSEKQNINNTNESYIFKFLKKSGLIGEKTKYGKISFWEFVSLVLKTIYKRIIFNYAYKNLIFEPINKKRLRPYIWRCLGAKVGNNVMIGHFVRIDFGNAELIEIKDNVIISNGVTLLCHKRDVTNYTINTNANDLPFVYDGILLNKGCQIGLNSTILPGITIGEGAIIGSCSVVTKDIPAWSIAVGNPAKVIKNIQ